MYVMSYAKSEVEPSAVNVIISACGVGEVWVYQASDGWRPSMPQCIHVGVKQRAKAAQLFYLQISRVAPWILGLDEPLPPVEGSKPELCTVL